MRNSILVFFIFVGLFIGCSDIDNQNLTDDYVVDLHILDNGMVNFEGDVMSLDRFSNELETFEMTKETIVQLKTDKNVTVGHVTDVQKIMRDKGTLRINFAAAN